MVMNESLGTGRIIRLRMGGPSNKNVAALASLKLIEDDCRTETCRYASLCGSLFGLYDKL